MKSSKNIILVVAVLALGAVSWLTIWMMGKNMKRETAPVHNSLRGFALENLGPEAVVLPGDLDLTGDGAPDVVAYTPADPAFMPPDAAFACERLMVATFNKRKFRTLLTVDAAGLRGEDGAALTPQVAAPQGYFVATALDNRGRLSFVLTLRDKAGRPASDPLNVRWDADAGVYTASNL